MKVTICCIEKVKYEKTVEIDDEVWESMEMQNEDGLLERPSTSELSWLVDVNDVIDSEGYENIEIYEVDKNGNKAKGGKELCCW